MGKSPRLYNESLSRESPETSSNSIVTFTAQKIRKKPYPVTSEGTQLQFGQIRLPSGKLFSSRARRRPAPMDHPTRLLYNFDWVAPQGRRPDDNLLRKRRTATDAKNGRAGRAAPPFNDPHRWPGLNLTGRAPRRCFFFHEDLSPFGHGAEGHPAQKYVSEGQTFFSEKVGEPNPAGIFPEHLTADTTMKKLRKADLPGLLPVR